MGLAGALVAVLVGAGGAVFFASLLVFDSRARSQDATAHVAMIIIGALFQCIALAGIFVLMDRLWLQPALWRRWGVVNEVERAWAHWRTACARAWGVRMARDKLVQVCRAHQPAVVAVVPQTDNGRLQPLAGGPFLEPEFVTARASRPLVALLGTVLAIVVALFLLGLYRQTPLPCCGTFLVMILGTSYVANGPMKLSVGSGVVEHRARRWTVDDAVMLVTRTGFFAIRVRLVGAGGELQTHFRSTRDRQFQALWQRWTTAVPRTDLPAMPT